MKSMYLLLLVISLFLIYSALDAAPAFPLKISSNGRYLMDQNNVPFFLNGDTPWELFTMTTREDAEYYLEDRRQKGINGGLCELFDHAFTSNPPNNLYGEGPFSTPGDFSTPNEAYFAHVDWVVNKAAEKGFVLLITPCYTGGGSQGWGSEMGSNGVTKCRNLGRYIGNRYKNAHNIIWVGGGDGCIGSSGLMPEMDAIMEGIRESEGGNQKLQTAHSSRNNSALDCYDRPWLDLNSTYSSCDNVISESLVDWNDYLSRKRWLRRYLRPSAGIPERAMRFNRPSYGRLSLMGIW
jgi:hypothetical protein